MTPVYSAPAAAKSNPRPRPLHAPQHGGRKLKGRSSSRASLSAGEAGSSSGGGFEALVPHRAHALSIHSTFPRHSGQRGPSLPGRGLSHSWQKGGARRSRNGAASLCEKLVDLLLLDT